MFSTYPLADTFQSTSKSEVVKMKLYPMTRDLTSQICIFSLLTQVG